MKSTKGWEVGAKIRRKALRRRGEIDNNCAVNSVQYRQKVGQKNEVNVYKLYVFPTFDPSDALLFLPTSFATYFNSSNSIEMSRLITSHMAKNCEMNLHVLTDDNISTNAFFQFYDLLQQLNPDSIMCVHSTKVENSQIRATLFIKYTACKAIYDSMARVTKDALFDPMFTVREASMKRGISRGDIPENEKRQYYARLQTDEDLLVYVKAEMVLTIDEATKKVTRFALRGRITSIEPVDASVTRGGDDSLSLGV